MTTNAELIDRVQERTLVEESRRQVTGSTINPELLAMASLLPSLGARHTEFLKRRMAFDFQHFQERRVRPEDLADWRNIMSEVRDILPQVPADIHPLPRAWKPVFSDVMQLYGNPEWDS